eukprot:TRINITY_DN7062_c1_g1_i3.p1 TRINITY_DN7062_c1_g1~~TRINITY_DN7062_c1_g1_i3.p1  ORF type:complete len:424 (-),score=61.84 TRINITY_DN7062_c1_g1_i3:937-2070(-)
MRSVIGKSVSRQFGSRTPFPKQRRTQVRVCAYKVQKLQSNVAFKDENVERKILVAVDDSEDSEIACKWAINHLFREGDKYYIVHVMPQISDAAIDSWAASSNFTPPLEPTTIPQQLQEKEQVKIKERFSKICDDCEVPYEIDVAAEDSALSRQVPIGKVICDLSENMDVVVIGSHGKGWLAEMILGSVSNYVKHHSTKPFILLHNTHLEQCDANEPCFVDRSIVIAVNDTQQAQDAFQWTIDNLYRVGDEIHLMHIVPQMPVESVYFVGCDNLTYGLAPTGRNMDESKDEIKEYINKRFEGELQKKDIPYKIDIIFELSTDNKKSIGEKLCKRAAAMEARVVVMGAPSNKSTLADHMFGSVSSYVSHNSKVPVLLLH